MPVSYRNPVHPGHLADPSVLRDGDRVLAFGTGAMDEGRSFEVLTSPDQVTWTVVGGALEPPVGVGADFWGLSFARDVLDGDRVGTILAVDRLDTMTSLSGEPVEVLRPNADGPTYEPTTLPR